MPDTNQRPGADAGRSVPVAFARQRSDLAKAERYCSERPTKSLSLLALLTATAFLSAPAASDPATLLKPTGLVCVDPIPKQSVWKGNDTGATEKSVFTIQIDDRPPIKVSTETSGVFTNLPTNSKHLVRIQLDGKPLTSFRFSFHEHASNHLRLWYYTMYGNWCLWPTDGKHKCAYPKTQRS